MDNSFAKKYLRGIFTYKSNPQALDKKKPYVLAYRNSPQTFTSNESLIMCRRVFLRKAVVGVVLGAAALVGIPNVAQTPAKTNQVTSASVAENKETKPYVFKDLTQNFGIDGGSKELTVAFANMEGHTNGFDQIRVKIYDYNVEKTTMWWVGKLLEPPDSALWRKCVLLFDMDLLKGIDNNIKPLAIDENSFVTYVEKLLNDVKNLTGIKPEKVKYKQNAE